ncbi:MAG: hypothetical protein MUO72_04355 [Bacteroidales bacterium]|nr:hypothetical protein [Bacteroidales bacterium]
MRIIKCLSIVILISLAFGSCRKIQQLPAIPRIEFTSFAVFDTTDILGNDCKGGRLNFYFEDGDGNLGLHSPESGETDTTNLFLTLFRETGGIMVQVPDNDPIKPSAYRIPYMDRTGQNKILKGTISITFIYWFYEPIDSGIFRYDFFIKDRAGNISNTASTSEIALSVNDLYKNK